MLAKEYKLVLELSREDGTRLGQVGVEIDWEPAREWTRFQGIRRGLLPLTEPVRTIAVEPLWHRSAGAPYLRGFRVSISGNGRGAATEDFPITYFQALARKASAQFVEAGRLKEGERFHYLAAAYPDRGGSPSAPEARFEPEEIEPVIPYRAKPLSESMAWAVPEGTVDAVDMPVFIPRQILDEAEAATLATRETESGGILIGHLLHDENLPEIFAEITAQIPTRGNGEAAKLTFSAETWTAVRAAVDIRNRQEIFLGFWHSHPVRAWCQGNECSMEKLQKCPLAKGFFSQDDQAMFRTVFPRAYSLALVCSDAPIGRPTFSLFGWRNGMIGQRGFYVSATKAAGGPEVR